MFRASARFCGQLRPVWPAILVSTVLLADCGGGSGYGGSSNNMMMPMAPSVSISVDPMAITLGQSVQLSWTVTNAASCTASGGWSGNIDPNGKQQTVTPTASGNVSYTLSCTAPTGGGYSGGGGGQTSKSASLVVNPASAYSASNLVSTSGNGALNADGNLVNGWGIVFGPATPVWVANNHSDTSTVYDGTGKAILAGPTSAPGTPLVVKTPDLDPTGIVFNGSASDFKFPLAASTVAAVFIFAGESGQLEAWASAAGDTAVTVYPTGGAGTGGAIYKGLAIANNGAHPFLYATDFHNNRIDVFDTTFAKQTLAAGAFVDPTLPAGYAPFGIQAITTGNTTQIYVAYAKQDDQAEDDAPGAGAGLIDIFDVGGTFIKHLVAVGGALNAPWGMALAPADFGTMSNMLLVGNFGDGKINGYDPSSGTYMGAITDSTGTPISSAGLWGIAFGNDAHSQPHNTLYFAAGPDDENAGVYGRIDLTPPPAMH